MMNKIKAFFQFNQRYKFDITDLTALIYTICAIGVMCGVNMTIMFFIGAAVATAFCWQSHRVNVIVLNVALFAMNAYNLIIMISEG